MHFHIKVPVGLKSYFQQEIGLAAQALAKGELARAWRHLERTHILGQAYPLEHSYAHWKMLQFGFRIKSVKEIR